MANRRHSWQNNLSILRIIIASIITVIVFATCFWCALFLNILVLIPLFMLKAGIFLYVFPLQSLLITLTFWLLVRLAGRWAKWLARNHQELIWVIGLTTVFLVLLELFIYTRMVFPYIAETEYACEQYGGPGMSCQVFEQFYRPTVFITPFLTVFFLVTTYRKGGAKLVVSKTRPNENKI